jgi:transposase
MARHGSPECVCCRQVAAAHGKRAARKVERKVLRCCYHTLRELAGGALPVPAAKQRQAA